MSPLKTEPPATPPFRFSTSEPGLFTSNDLITINRAGEVKSRVGIGTFLHRYSQTNWKFETIKIFNKLSFFSVNYIVELGGIFNNFTNYKIQNYKYYILH